MRIKSAVPYVFFDGRAEEAIAFYQQALEAKVQVLQRFGEMQQNCPEALKERVVHAALELGSAVLLLSDGPVQEGAFAANTSIALTFEDEAEARSAFDSLAAGGKVIEALFQAPWGGLFGALKDRFGIQWMFTTAH